MIRMHIQLVEYYSQLVSFSFSFFFFFFCFSFLSCGVFQFNLILKQFSQQMIKMVFAFLLFAVVVLFRAMSVCMWELLDLLVVLLLFLLSPMWKTFLIRKIPLIVVWFFGCYDFYCKFFFCLSRQKCSRKKDWLRWLCRWCFWCSFWNFQAVVVVFIYLATKIFLVLLFLFPHISCFISLTFGIYFSLSLRK